MEQGVGTARRSWRENPPPVSRSKMERKAPAAVEQVFAPEARGATAPCVGDGAALDVSEGAEEAQQLFLRVRDKLGEQFAQTVADAGGEASGSGVRRRRRVARMALVEPQDQRTFHEQGISHHLCLSER